MEKLLAINGLRWPIATSGTQIQIGCQCHSTERWATFTDAQIAAMDSHALEFWHKHKELILAVATVRKGTP